MSETFLLISHFSYADTYTFASSGRGSVDNVFTVVIICPYYINPCPLSCNVPTASSAATVRIPLFLAIHHTVHTPADKYVATINKHASRFRCDSEHLLVQNAKFNTRLSEQMTKIVPTTGCDFYSLQNIQSGCISLNKDKKNKGPKIKAIQELSRIKRNPTVRRIMSENKTLF